MTIRRALLAASITAATLATVAAVSVFFSARSVDDAVQNGYRANRLVSKFGELRVLTTQYLLTDSTADRVAWKRSLRENRELLAASGFSSGGEQRMTTEMARRLDRMETLFDRIVSARATSVTSRKNETPNRDDLLATTTSYRELGLSLNTYTLHEIDEASDQARLLTIVLVAALVLVAMTSTALVNRRIVRSLDRLQRGIAIVGGGDLGFRQNAAGRDEISQVARAFDEMAGRLEAEHSALVISNRELESFSYSVSHDLRAPLRAIDGFSKILLDEHRDRLDETGRDYLGRIRSETGRMGVLIEELLQLSRVVRYELSRERVSLSSLAEQALASLREAEPEREAEASIEPGLEAYGDTVLLRLALENLLGNAWKFTSLCDRAQIEFGAREENGQRVFFVRDNGAGFDMVYADQLFSPFQRLHRQDEFPGNGVGLATVERIVDRHGGRIWASAEPGRGATFSFTLSQEGAAR